MNRHHPKITRTKWALSYNLADYPSGHSRTCLLISRAAHLLSYPETGASPLEARAFYSGEWCMSSKANDDFDDLLSAIEAYCKALRAASGHVRSKAVILRGMARRALPMVTRRAGEGLPDELFARWLISLGVVGAQTNNAVALWEHYYVAGQYVASIAYRMRCSSRTVQRQVRAFPRNVAAQLWEKNLELTSSQNTPSLRPTTRLQRRIRSLEDRYGLTEKEAEVFLAFRTPSRNRGRRAIVDELCISENTIKKHIGKTIRKVGGASMNDALDIAEPFFEEVRRREREELD